MPSDPGGSALGERAAETPASTELTNRQTLFWLGQKLSGDHPVYNIAFVYEIDGPVDPELFGRAFAAIVDSTDSLRIVIEEVDGVPRQRVLPRLEIELEIVDLSAASQTGREYERWLEQRLARRLHMAERLFDTALLRLAPERYAWFLNQHHIVTDGWSMAIIYRRVADAYVRLRDGGSARDIATAPSFLDYVDRERDQRASSEFERAERYRLRKLATEIPSVRFYGAGPLERSRYERRTVLRLDAERTRRVRHVATEAQMPTRLPQQALYLVFSTLLAVYLHRLSDHRDIGIGLVFHNRHTDQDRETAGLYVNLFPLHLHLEPEDTFVTVMRKSLAESFAAVRYGPHCISNPGRQRSYEVLFNYLPMTYEEFAAWPVSTRWAHTGASDGNHSLSLHVHDFDATGELSLVFDLNTGVFDEADDARVLADFEALVDEFLDDPEGWIGSPSLAAAAEPSGSSAADEPSPAAPSDVRAPDGEIETRLVDIWEDLLGHRPIGVDDDFFALGGHSLLAVSLATRLERELGWSLPLTRIFEQPTIAELARSVRREDSVEAAERAPSDLLMPVRSTGRRPAFFCVPGAGGHGFRLYGLAHQLPDDRPFYAFQPLAEEPGRALEQTASTYCEALRTLQPSGPYRLGGTCLGAFVAYEMGRQFEAEGEEVAVLAMLNVQGDPDYRAYLRGAALLDRGLRLLGRQPPPRHDRLIDLLWWLRRRRRAALEVEADPAPEFRALALEQTRSALAYRPRPYGGRVTLFVAAETPERAVHEERAEWESLAAGGVEVLEVPGDQDTALEPPHVGELAGRLAEVLARSDGPAA